MAKYKLIMQIELDIDGTGTYNEVMEAALRADPYNVETRLVDESDIVVALETHNVRQIGLMGAFIDILKRGKA